MAGLLIDTGIVIDHLRGREPATRFLAGLASPPSLSVVTVTELYAGVYEGAERRELEAFLACCEAHDVGRDIALEAGLLSRTYRRSHGAATADALIAATADALIAATALHHGLMLATLNRKHFPMIAGLVVPH